MGILDDNLKDFVYRGCKYPGYTGPIDKEAVNDAFKKCKKEILDVFLAENGFYKWRATKYVRLNAEGLLQMIELQKDRFDPVGFYVNYEVLPLYVPNIHLRSGKEGYLEEWYYADYEMAKISFENIRDAIKIGLLPWFDEFCDDNTFRKMLMRDKDKKGPGYRNEDWRMALERSEEERKAVILENIEKWKLPKKLAQGFGG